MLFGIFLRCFVWVVLRTAPLRVCLSHSCLFVLFSSPFPSSFFGVTPHTDPLLPSTELSSDPTIRSHLASLYDNLLEQNLLRIIEPYSTVEIAHVAELVGQERQGVEAKCVLFLFRLAFSLFPASNLRRDGDRGWLIGRTERMLMSEIGCRR